MRQTIDAAAFQQMVIHAAAAISVEKQQVNDLNVFPVPDGDTGTNMSLTIAAAAGEMKKKSYDTVGQAAQATASALLRGARGNSGVILSLLFRGFAKAIKDRETMDGRDLAIALDFGVAAAYKAVMKPAEGTILTVSRMAAARAAGTAREDNCAEAVLAAAIEEGQAALADTVNQNPVLKKAGVVDAGGKGFLIILQGMLDQLQGKPMPELSEEEPEEEKADFGALSAEEITFAFDTVFIVRKPSPHVNLEPFRTYLNGIGDSLVIGEDDEAFKVHVHTNIPGAALTEAQKYGTLELAKIENMRTQYEDVMAGRKAQSVDDLEDDDHPEKSGAPAAPEKRYGFLSVCAGEGLATVFRDLGVDGIISGGQTMNPSTESILKEIDKVPAEVVFVLPNNKNIIMAAQQCVGLTEKEVVVVPTATIPQGVTAMMSVDLELEPQELLETMTSAIENVSTAQITYAARDSEFDGFTISEGDYLALLGGKLFGTDKDITALLEKLAQQAKDQSAEFVTIFYGEDVSDEQAQAAEEIFSRACPGAELSVLPGGQPVYYYIVSIE